MSESVSAPDTACCATFFLSTCLFQAITRSKSFTNTSHIYRRTTNWFDLHFHAPGRAGLPLARYWPKSNKSPPKHCAVVLFSKVAFDLRKLFSFTFIFFSLQSTDSMLLCSLLRRGGGQPFGGGTLVPIHLGGGTRRARRWDSCVSNSAVIFVLCRYAYVIISCLTRSLCHPGFGSSRRDAGHFISESLKWVIKLSL